MKIAASRRKLVLISIVVLLILSFGARLAYRMLTTESTDDAFIVTHVHTITPQVQGMVKEVLVNDGQEVKKGDLLVQIKPRGKAVLVTDAMPTVGTDATSFALFGRPVRRERGHLVTDDGTLAGADIDLAASVKNCVELLDLPLEEGLRMASLYPAAYLGLDGERGRIAPGYRADLTLLGPELGALATWVDGEEQWPCCDSDH